MPDRPVGDIAFTQFLGEEKLMGSRCGKCGRLYAPPRSMCTRCFVTDMQWADIVPFGKLAAFTCISVVPKCMSEAGYGKHNPYCVGVVQLEEGPRVVARIVGVDTKNPETIHIGTQLKATFLHPAPGESDKTVLAFTPSFNDSATA